MHTQQTITAACERLWRRAMHEPVSSYVETERVRDASYVKGFRNDITMRSFEAGGGFSVRTLHVVWQRYALSADESGIRRIIEVYKGASPICKFVQEGEAKTVRFGDAERYLGTEYVAATGWKTDAGSLPNELVNTA